MKAVKTVEQEARELFPKEFKAFVKALELGGQDKHSYAELIEREEQGEAPIVIADALNKLKVAFMVEVGLNLALEFIDGKGVFTAE